MRRLRLKVEVFGGSCGKEVERERFGRFGVRI
jgi:hypothetical protein